MENTPRPADCAADTRADMATQGGWRDQLPALTGRRVVLRELRDDDAAALHALLATEEVGRFISPPPPNVDQFRRFVQWTRRRRAAGDGVCFAVTVSGSDTAIGLFQVRTREGSFELAEWGFAIGSAFWGSGVFQESAELVLEFAFVTLGVRRLEARAALLNGRGNGALRKIGAVQECVLRFVVRAARRMAPSGSLRDCRRRSRRPAASASRNPAFPLSPAGCN